MRGKLGATFILGLAILFRIGRAQLAGIENPIIAAWPTQIIFGFYFAVLTLAIQGIQSQFAAKGHSSPRQSLLLLGLIGFCLDLVLVNIQEIVVHVDASYGLVALWDVATFFIWLRAVDLCRTERHAEFRISWLISVAPLLKLGREILFVPYATTSFRAYFDLVFGDLFVCLWLFISLSKQDARKQRIDTLLANFVLAGCWYWLLNAIENILFLAWPPLVRYETFTFLRIAPFSLSGLYFLVAGIATFVVWRWDILRLGTRFGTARRKAKSQAES